MSFRESQHGIVFNPWLCGSPRMPSLLLSLPQRQGIKDTLHLFDLVFLLRLFYSVILERNVALLFCVSGWKSWDISVFSLWRCMMAFFAIIVRCYCHAGEFLFLNTHTGNNMVYRLCDYESINEIKSLSFHCDPYNAKNLCCILRKTAQYSVKINAVTILFYNRFIEQILWDIKFVLDVHIL